MKRIFYICSTHPMRSLCVSAQQYFQSYYCLYSQIVIALLILIISIGKRKVKNCIPQWTCFFYFIIIFFNNKKLQYTSDSKTGNLMAISCITNYVNT